MDTRSYMRTPEGHAEEHPNLAHGVVRIEIMQEADDGAVFTVVLLDADDSFDILVDSPDGTTECVWSLTRERPHQG
jgi:hypothetical protein